MNILVCVKQVRESSQPGALWILNPADACAVEMALCLRQAQGGTVTVLTMGRESAEDMLRELIARGVDRACLITDALYAGSDTLATAKVLRAAVQTTGPYDLILTGRRAVDGETALTPARLAALLCWPLISDVQRMDGPGECLCQSESQQKRVRYALPAVVTVHEGSCSLRLMGILGMRRAKKADILRLTNEQLRLDPGETGLSGSPTRVYRATNAPEPIRATRWLASGRELAQVLRAHREEKSREKTAFVSKNRLSGPVWVLAEEENEDSRALVSRAFALSGRAPRLLLVSPRENTLELARMVAQRVAEEHPETILAVSTGFLRALAPQVATFLNTGLTADCTDLQATESGLLLQIRPTYGGAQLAEILCPQARPQMALVRGGVLEAQEASPCETERIEQPENGPVCCLSRASGVESSLRQARLVIAGGLGVGSREGFETLGELAGLLGGELAATRAAVDAGYAPYRMQVGQTGVTVRPALYLTFGVSGAIQHVLGMNQSGRILSVNIDPKAPVFRYSDYGLVGDWRTAINEMKEELNP